jgi:hypothetical protein
LGKVPLGILVMIIVGVILVVMIIIVVIVVLIILVTISKNPLLPSAFAVPKVK